MKESESVCLFENARTHARERLLRSPRSSSPKKGFTVTRLEDVAAMAGVSKTTIDVYFKSKELLFKSVIGRRLVSAVEAVDELAADTRVLIDTHRCPPIIQ
jgi:AcrR family transcriptional regulator